MYKEVLFMKSAATADGLTDYNLPEIVFAGRSNVGKSSLINFITGDSKLARTSSLPGRTRLVNYFKIDGKFVIVDLPGYGFAKAAKEDKQKWQELIEAYFMKSQKIKRVFLLVDIRHTPTEQDIQMLSYLFYYQIPVSIIATKSDEIKPSEKILKIREIAKTLKIGTDNIIPVSIKDKRCLSSLQNLIDEVL